jgi:DNA invertase Pin-like site-specific DNA recombinase
MKAIGYVRCSTSEQADSHAGLDAQRVSILEEARRRGWDEIQIIEDAGYSAKDLKRPGIQLALEALRAGRADVLVVAKLDRLSRSLLDFATIMQTATRERWGLIALDLGVDTASISGRAVASVLAVFSQLEREMIGLRTKEALAARKAAGVKLGRPRLMGADVAATIAALRRDGLTMAAIADKLTLDGVPTVGGGRSWYASTVRRVLKRDDAEG